MHAAIGTGKLAIVDAADTLVALPLVAVTVMLRTARLSPMPTLAVTTPSLLVVVASGVTSAPLSTLKLTGIFSSVTPPAPVAVATAVILSMPLLGRLTTGAPLASFNCSVRPDAVGVTLPEPPPPPLPAHLPTSVWPSNGGLVAHSVSPPQAATSSVAVATAVSTRRPRHSAKPDRSRVFSFI